MPYDINKTRSPAWASAVSDLADRIVGAGAGERLRLTQQPTNQRSFTVAASCGVLNIAATDALAACVGLHHYLRSACNISISWDTTTPIDIDAFPDHPPVSRAARVPEIYYLNFCTFSYTTAFWDWDEWEREIDWMALHGISMPLAAVGHEAVLHTALQRLGLSDEEVRTHLGAPAHLPFMYMGCVQGVGGPLSQEWITDHLTLGRRILERERSLGMTPVLPAFVGSVPPTLETDEGEWRTWEGFHTLVIAPSDPLYRRITREITAVQLELFGTDHLYAADPFIEMIPVDSDPDYPAQVAAATLAGLTDADPDATWVLQAWPFSYNADFWSDDRVRRFLGSIDTRRIRLLDLWAEQSPQWSQRDGFDGRPWIWCVLLNFGGRTDVVGDLTPVIGQLEAAETSDHPPAGIGLTMEGIHNNPLYFELALDLAWTTPDVASSWFADAALQRYALADNDDIRTAWADIADTLYVHPGGHLPTDGFHGTALTRPTFDLLDSITPEATALWFTPSRLVRAWQTLLTTAERAEPNVPAPLARDLVDLTAGVAQRVVEHRLAGLINATTTSGFDQERGDQFLATFDDLDAVLSSRPESRWATWEAQAARWDHHSPTGALTSARRLLTTWGPTAGTPLDDYGRRAWGGLVGGYYRQRWEAWLENLPLALSGDRATAQTNLDLRLSRLADDFCAHGPAEPSGPRDTTTQQARRLFDQLATEFSQLPHHPPQEVPRREDAEVTEATTRRDDERA